MARVYNNGGDHTVLPGTHTRTIPAITPQPQGVTAIWLHGIKSFCVCFTTSRFDVTFLLLF